MIFVDDVPDLHQIGILRGEFPHEFARSLGRVDLHNRRIAEIKLWSRYTRYQWSGHGDSWRFRGNNAPLSEPGDRQLHISIRGSAHLKIPKWPANIDDRRDPAAQIPCERVVQVRLDPCDFVFVGADAVKIDNVRPREQVSRLKEVNM